MIRKKKANENNKIFRSKWKTLIIIILKRKRNIAFTIRSFVGNGRF